MLVRGIEWVGERVHIHFYDTDGSNETVVLLPSEALDILIWLQQNREKLLKHYGEAVVRKEIGT